MPSFSFLKKISFLLQVLDAIKGDSCKNDETLENKLEVRIDTKEGKTVCKGCEYDNTYRRSTYLSNTAIE